VTQAVVPDAALAERTRANGEFFAVNAESLARVCRSMAERFIAGGRLVAFGSSPAAWSDARHVAVEFVHPVIVGKRALPAIALPPDQAELLVAPDDIVMAFGDGDALGALAVAADRGCLTLAFTARSGAEHEFLPPSRDPSVRQELVETLYHVLWELVHVFLEHSGGGRDAGEAAGFLYPFLGERQTDLESVVDDVRRSVLAKSEDVGALRAQTLTDNRDELVVAARETRAALDAGGKVLALGNGGSATDAMDVVADLRIPPDSRWRPRRAIDLTDDSSIITAVANDIGVEAIFTRQIIAYGSPGDVLLALSTSGNSANVIAALAEARRREMRTIAMVGYDGGRVLAERVADHVIVTRSEHIPRIQEAQASAYHVWRELIEA
jgi:D-sedoheptulose 7-phosphate isomerase